MTTPQPGPHEAMEQGRAAARARYGLVEQPSIPPELVEMADTPINRGRLQALARHGDQDNAAAARLMLAHWDRAAFERRQYEQAVQAWQQANVYGTPPPAPQPPA